MTQIFQPRDEPTIIILNRTDTAELKDELIAVNQIITNRVKYADVESLADLPILNKLYERLVEGK